MEWNPIGLVGYRDFAAFFNSQSCDLAIAPLQDNLFNRAKSHIKFLEYSALGFPGVYSRLEPYAQVVEDGENGLLAGSLVEWEAQLTALIEDSSLRARLGTAAQETVRRDWLLSDHAAAWAQAYQKIYEISTPERSLIAERPLFADPKNVQAIMKAQSWQKELETSSRQLAQELEQREREYGQATALYQDLVNSTDWKVFQKISRLKNKLAPPGSWRDRSLHLGFYSLLVLRRTGIKGFAPRQHP